jgi:hypothetical protein
MNDIFEDPYSVQVKNVVNIPCFSIVNKYIIEFFRK